MPVVRPGELALGYSGGNIRHSGEAEIDAVRQNAQMGEGVGKSRAGVHLKQQIGDADRRQTLWRGVEGEVP